MPLSRKTALSLSKLIVNLNRELTKRERTYDGRPERWRSSKQGEAYQDETKDLDHLYGELIGFANDHKITYHLKS